MIRPSHAGHVTVNWHNRRNLRPALNLRLLRAFSARLRRHLDAAGLPCGNFDVTLASNRELARLNREFRSKASPTDVLSFPWRQAEDTRDWFVPRDFEGFLGDIVISVEAAARNARAEGHSPQTELKQLILHGALHLLGYDHKRDRGEMNSLELRLRRELGIE